MSSQGLFSKEKSMVWFVRIVFVSVCLCLTGVTMADDLAEDVETTVEIRKSGLMEIRIIGTQVDNICFFITDSENRTFRISALSEKEANHILSRLKDDQSILIKTIPSKRRDYRNVVSWQ